MIKINLLPKESRKRVGLGQQIFTLIFVLVAAFVAIGFYWSYLNGVIEQKTLEIAKTQQRLQELQKIQLAMEERTFQTAIDHAEESRYHIFGLTP